MVLKTTEYQVFAIWQCIPTIPSPARREVKINGELSSSRGLQTDLDFMCRGLHSSHE